jgi:hypothetical protein
VDQVTQDASDAKAAWGGRVMTGLQESAPLLAPPVVPHCVAHSVPQVIRFVWSADPGAVVYYHHGNLLEDARREPLIRHKGRYVAVCIQFDILHPRQRRGVAGDTHYYAVRSPNSLHGLPRNVFDGTITPDEFQALCAVKERQASMATSRAIRDALGVSESDASDMRNSFIRRGWLTNGRPPELTDLGLSMMT